MIGTEKTYRTSAEAGSTLSYVPMGSIEIIVDQGELMKRGAIKETRELSIQMNDFIFFLGQVSANLEQNKEKISDSLMEIGNNFCRAYATFLQKGSEVKLSVRLPAQQEK